MTPPARLSAAIEVLDLYLAGQPVEKALTNWARRSRYAGSKDRAAVRDIVFDCLRRRNMCELMGHSLTGRGLVLGALKSTGTACDELDALFSGEGHAPAVLTEEERSYRRHRVSPSDRLDMPAWLLPELDRSLDEATRDAVCEALKQRADVFLRVNLSRATRDQVAQKLREEGIETEPHDLAQTCLRVTENPRRVAQSRAYEDGVIELQDAASQALCAGLPKAARMLDYCAGGGGKVLAYGDQNTAELFAHDAHVARLRDLPPRAQRAGLTVHILDSKACEKHAPFDLVLCDAPCSGSGAWRRSPAGKWALTAKTLADVTNLQERILQAAAPLVAGGGVLAYATCSVLKCENSEQIQRFVDETPGFHMTYERQYLPTEGGDGFYIAYLTKGA